MYINISQPNKSLIKQGKNILLTDKKNMNDIYEDVDDNGQRERDMTLARTKA